MGRKRVIRWGRLGAVVVLGGLMSFAAAGVASAADATTTPVTGVAGTEKHGNKTIEYPLYAEGAKHDEPTRAGLITLAIGDNEPVEAYCIDLKNGLEEGGTYRETAWQSSAVTHLDKVQWILVHSYPRATPDQVLAVAGAAGLVPKGAGDEERKVLVYAATQGAIWHFSDGFNLGEYKGDDDAPSASDYPAVKKVYEYLRDNASSESEPAPALSIAPATATGELGTKLGPYTVTSSSPATVSATDGKIVDANGAEITGPLANGAKFWLTRDTAGKVTVDATATGAVPTGRVFTAVNPNGKFQKIILAGKVETKLVAHASGTFIPNAAPAPVTPSLPVTGASAVGAAVGGIALLVGGGVLVVLLRRRRLKFTA